LGPKEHPPFSGEDQGGRHRKRRHPRRRICLLKGCERSFLPNVPQQRYCCPECSEAAARWRKKRAQAKYRKTKKAKKRRREQSVRYRARVRERGKVKPETAPQESVLEEATAREGHHPAPILEGSLCARPGCYEVVVPDRRSVLQKFCSCNCRKALCRVLERERRWGFRQKGPPESSAKRSQDLTGSLRDRCSIYIVA
jgi:hypothetical protein